MWSPQVQVRSVKRDKAWYERRQTYGFEASNTLKLCNWNADDNVCDTVLVKSAANNFGEIIPPWMRMSASVTKSTDKGKSVSDLSVKSVQHSANFWQKISQESEPVWLRELKLRRSLREQRFNEEDNKPEPQKTPWINVKLRPTGMKLYADTKQRKNEEADQIPYALKLPEISQFSAARAGVRDTFLHPSEEHGILESLEHKAFRRSTELVKIVEESPPVSADFSEVNKQAESFDQRPKDLSITSLKSPTIVNEIVNFDSSVDRKIVVMESDKTLQPKGILKKRQPWPETLKHQWNGDVKPADHQWKQVQTLTIFQVKKFIHFGGKC